MEMQKLRYELFETLKKVGELKRADDRGDIRYELFETLNKVAELKKFDNGGYSKMVRTGDLDFYDYGMGHLNFEIRPCFSQGRWTIRIWIATVDDGDMGGWIPCPDEESARERIREFAEGYLAPLQFFPSLEELNRDLQGYGFSVQME